jgi:caspase domain-containing protein/putative peptidoglycan binding protein
LTLVSPDEIVFLIGYFVREGIVRFLRPIAAFLLVSLCFALPAHAERRVALVIGNAEYAHTAKLRNPRADAEAMAGLLESLGFKVVRGVNLGLDAMTDHINRFAQEAGGADVALFFYAGHAFQLEGRNLLVPVDASIKNEFEARRRTIEIDSILDFTMESAKVRLVLLDGCRDNPFADQMASKTRNVVLTPGLAEMKSAKGTLIAFATSPGKAALDGEGRNSPFTRALLVHMPTPGLEIGLALKRVRAQVVDETREQQLPWDHNSMTGEFFMKPAEGGSPPQGAAPAVARATGGFDERSLELELWTSIKSSTNPDDFRAYLGRYPHGTFAEVARNRIDDLSRPGGSSLATTSPPSVAPATADIKTAEASRATQDALGLTTDDWKQVQLRLMKYGTRSIDGNAGEGTRSSLKSWQAVRGYPVSGYLNRLQYEALLREEPAPAPAQTTTSVSRSALPQQQRRSKTETGDKSGSGQGSSDQVVKGIGQGIQIIQMLKGR